jgi:class 3 adenylate cyclase
VKLSSPSFSRLGPLDRALVLVLVPLWILCFGLAVRSQLLGHGVAPVELRVADGESYPVLTGAFIAEIYQETDPLEAAGLRAGDRLLRAGPADLRGVGTIGFNARIMQHAAELSVPIVFERDGVRRETVLPLASLSFGRSNLPSALAVVAAGLFLILRAQPTPTVRAYFYTALCGGFFRTQFPGPGLQIYLWVGVFWIAAALFFPLTLRFMLRFPDDRVPWGRWHAIWPWLFVVLGPFNALAFLGPQAVGTTGFFVTAFLALSAMLVVVTRKYGSADAVARRQMRWFVFGCYCVALPPATAALLTALDPRLAWLWWASFWVSPLLPLAIVISVIRFNLFDVDRLFSATASYNVLAVALVAGALVAVPRIADSVAGVAGIDRATSQTVLSVVLAALVIPAHSRLRQQIDRVFFKERYALDQGVAELLPTLSACAGVRELTERVGRELQRLLRPEACVVYARVEDSYAPVFAAGRAVPSAFDAGSPLVGTLRARRAPLSLSAVGRRADAAALGPFDRAALETLGAEVVVPVQQRDALAAFVCLGPKRSGDVYTSTDLSLLAAVAETISLQLQRFDQDAVIRAGREMQESLRRYVPGAVAEQLAGGTELSTGEREVTVLFVDIRGYTGFSESRRAEEIFSTVNRYTETVTQVVQRHAGSVVEFNGDGMMAVFGAPRELAHKERAAVEAGRAIVAAVGSLGAEIAGDGQLSVGVGIATGEAFVGNIRAVDRMIWTVIGNTTNLAARLQSLTRGLDAAIVIDDVTWERAQPGADFQKRRSVPIRGRRESHDLYALPLHSASPEPVLETLAVPKLGSRSPVGR